MKKRVQNILFGFQGQIIFLLIIIGGLSIAIMGVVHLSDDEFNYIGGAKTVAKYVHSFSNTQANAEIDLKKSLVAQGWRMPGMSIILSPVFIAFGSDAPLSIARIYVLLLNLVLLYLICMQVARTASKSAARIFLLVCLFVPYYVYSLSTFFSELLSLHLAILFLFYIDKRLSEGNDVAVDIAAFMIAALTYIRALYPSFVAVVAVAWFLNQRHEKDVGLVKHSLGVTRKSIALLLIFLGLMFPWSIFVSESYGPSFFITSKRMGPLVKLADSSYRDEAKSVTGERYNWKAVNAYIELRAHENKIPFRQQLNEDKARYVPHLTVSERLSLIKESTLTYLGISSTRNRFLDNFFRLRCKKVNCNNNEFANTVNKINTVTWSIVLVVGMFLFAFPMRISPTNSYFMPFFWKAMLFALTIVPLFSNGMHSRYYAQYVPLFGIGIGFLFSKNVFPWRRSLENSYQDVLVGTGQVLALSIAVFISVVIIVV